MTDKELAEKVIALGVGEHHIPLSTGSVRIDAPGCHENYSVLGPSEFVRDWRVAGALMEKENEIEIRCVAWLNRDPGSGWDVNIGDLYNPVNGDPLPRAIIEACVEALA